MGTGKIEGWRRIGAEEERAMKREQAFRGIMEQAIGEMREALSQETAGDGDAQWDPDCWEQEVRRFTRRLGQELVQVWGEVKAEQSQAQPPFVLSAGEDATCSGGSPCGG